jgi:hypothetical protein
MRWLKDSTVAILLVCAIGVSMNVNGADLRFLDDESGVLSIRGEIKRGDAERLAVYLTEKRTIVALAVDSPGGDMEEAFRISSLIEGAKLGVFVGAGEKSTTMTTCSSACFFIFLAGQPRDAHGANDDGTLPLVEKWEAYGFIGIHRPYLKSPIVDSSSMQRQAEMMRRIRTYLSSEGVPQNLIDEMMSRPSNESYWLTKRDLDLIGEFDPPLEEALIAKCGYKRFSKVFNENWSKERRSNLTKCMLNFYAENLIPMREKFVAKLRSNWRPWTK